jgi:hypothetical protein
MSRKGAQWFCDNDMRKNKSLKRNKRIRESARRCSKLGRDAAGKPHAVFLIPL